MNKIENKKRIKRYRKERRQLLASNYSLVEVCPNHNKTLIIGGLAVLLLFLLTTYVFYQYAPFSIYEVYYCIKKISGDNLAEAIPRILIGVAILLIPYSLVHECLHALGWGAFSDKTKSISIGYIIINHIPYPCCNIQKPLNIWAYICGVMLPFVMLGLLPMMLGICLLSYGWVLTGILGIAGSVSDVSLFLILYDKDFPDSCIILDSPYGIACTAFIAAGDSE